MTKLNIDKILSQAQLGISKWELDNITWSDRATDPKTLIAFLIRIKELSAIKKPSKEQRKELEILQELSSDLDQEECIALVSGNDEITKQLFIEQLARTGAIEILTSGRIKFDTMYAMCKLTPNDFILVAKRTQDLIKSIQEFVIQGETLSNDMGGV